MRQAYLQRVIDEGFLHDNILIRICSNFNTSDLYRLTSVCKKFRETAFKVTCHRIESDINYLPYTDEQLLVIASNDESSQWPTITIQPSIFTCTFGKFYNICQRMYGTPLHSGWWIDSWYLDKTALLVTSNCSVITYPCANGLMIGEPSRGRLERYLNQTQDKIARVEDVDMGV